MIQGWLREFRRFPATMALCSLWVAVYLGMVATAWAGGWKPPWWGLLLGPTNGHAFGDLTIVELMRGEVWRVLTATFVHCGLLHLGMNLFGLYQLGCLVESWYGAGPFVLLYVLIGSGGNALAGLIRRVGGLNPYIHSAGGSTVLLGLVALCAVVGWRSRTRIGDYLKSQMLLVLAVTALLGLAPYIGPHIDNWGHVGGAVCGAVLGLGHRRLVRSAERPSARVAGLVGVVVIGLAVAFQVRAVRGEEAEVRAKVAAASQARARRLAAEQALGALVRVERLYLLALPRQGRNGLFLPRSARGAIPRAARELETTRPLLATGPASADFHAARDLLDRARTDLPTQIDLARFRRSLKALFAQALAERDGA